MTENKDATPKSLSEEQVKKALEDLGVFVADFDGTVYVKCNKLERALFGYGSGEVDKLITLKDFTERLNNKVNPN